MKFSLFFIAATCIFIDSNAAELEYDSDLLANENLFPQIAAYMAELGEDELDRIENYMSQIFAQDDQSDEINFAQLESEEENELAMMATYLA